MNNAETVLIRDFQETEENVLYKVLKRSFDIVTALIAFVFLIPILVFLKIVFLISGDKEKMIFKQKRIGKNGELFNLYKVRSMVPNADEVLFQTLKMERVLEEEYKVNKKLKDDPRITKIGKVIRKLSIDEMPQVINILKGDMSFIGNRPYLPREIEDMGSYYDEIIKTKPGLTGYWQVNGRSNTTFKERLELESYYSKHKSIKLDMKIFFKTFQVVLLKKGAK